MSFLEKSETDLIKETETFPTLTKDLFHLLKWLEEKEVTHIAMESTGVYWKPVYNILEDFFDITLANAQRIKNVPGRKTDVSDAEWIAKLLRHGLIEKSFVPPEDFRNLRDLTRLRKKMDWTHDIRKKPNPKGTRVLKHQIKHSYFQIYLEYQDETIGTTDE